MKHKQHNQQALSGYLFAISATALWSGNYIIASGLNESIRPINLAFWQWIVAVIVFLPFALKPLIVQWDVLKEHIGYLAITSLLGITTFNTLIYLAGHTTTALNLSLISITFPVFIVILSRQFFREQITINKGIGIILVAAGVVLLVTKGNLADLANISFAIGDVWMLIAAIIFAVYSILIRHKPEGLSIGPSSSAPSSWAWFFCSRFFSGNTRHLQPSNSTLKQLAQFFTLVFLLHCQHSFYGTKLSW